MNIILGLIIIISIGIVIAVSIIGERRLSSTIRKLMNKHTRTIKKYCNCKMCKKVKRAIEKSKNENSVSFEEVEKEFKELRKWEKKHPILTKIKSGYHRIKFFIQYDIKYYARRFFHRGIRGWANSDTWDFSYYLSEVIVGGLKHLRKYGHGATPTYKEYGKLIKTFKTAKRITAGEYCYTPSNEFNWNDYKKLKKFTKKLNRQYHTRDKVLTKRECIEFEKGFALFQKLFFRLWD